MDSRRQRTMFHDLEKQLGQYCELASANLQWLENHLNPYFFITMQDETEALLHLAGGLQNLQREQHLLLADRPDKQIIACLNRPGSLVQTLRDLQHRVITYAELTHSYDQLTGTDHELEIQRFEFGRKDHAEVAQATAPAIPAALRRRVGTAMRRLYPGYDLRELQKCLDLLWVNNDHYVRISPPERVARLLWLYQQGRQHGGLFLDVENTEDVVHHRETRVLFSVGNPPDRGFLVQALEVFHRMGLAVRRAYCLDISTGVHPYFLGTFYVTTREDRPLLKDSPLFRHLQTELYNTQILLPSGRVYTDWVLNGVLNGEQASLVNALVAFCHTNLAHNRPDRFDLAEVSRAFYANPELVSALCEAFWARFDPDSDQRDARGPDALAAARKVVDGYNTGHRHLDEVRRSVFRTALLLIEHTLKTNFFVPEKHALSFRLDPHYLKQLGSEFTSDLPAGEPFRITFFFGKHGAGYHIGFSDIARGGWRTIICSSSDDFTTNANTLFREVYVLAHTQHLKNKDIYEGGSKLGVVLDAHGLEGREAVTQRLYKLQYGFLQAFFDLYVTTAGRATHPRVVDYYGEDEPIELGPDENMHDPMIELIAREGERRGYVLGKGVISSKRIGINHKEYGVTSLGVVRFAEIALEQLGIDPARDPFTVKLTGGTNGDVAGNALRLLFERCAQVRVRLIVAGTGALFDPAGIDRNELSRLILREDVDGFDPAKLRPGGFILYRKVRRTEGLRELYRKIVRTASRVEEQWVTTDEFHREFDRLVFETPADLFIPAGGRPETIDGDNWQGLFDAEGQPSCRAIVEGANSFITPQARDDIQERGVIVLRDASANKCGVISSSYEILANLLMSDDEFLALKDLYVADVLELLEKRAEEEARLIFARQAAAQPPASYTQISNAISQEINEHYGRLFRFFEEHPAVAASTPFRRVMLAHLPNLVRRDARLRRRLGRLPGKIRSAVLAAELATRMVYHGGWGTDFETALRGYVRAQYG